MLSAVHKASPVGAMDLLRECIPTVCERERGRCGRDVGQNVSGWSLIDPACGLGTEWGLKFHRESCVAVMDSGCGFRFRDFPSKACRRMAAWRGTCAIEPLTVEQRFRRGGCLGGCLAHTEIQQTHTYIGSHCCLGGSPTQQPFAVQSGARGHEP